MNLTRNKDLDKSVLEKLDDRSLLNLMKTNREYLNLGNDFYRNKIARSFPSSLERKPIEQNWANYYLDLVYYSSKLKEEFNLDYDPNYDPKKLYKSFKTDEGLVLFYKTEKLINSKASLDEMLYSNDFDFVHGINYSIKTKNPFMVELIELYLRNEFLDDSSEILSFIKSALETKDNNIFALVFSTLLVNDPDFMNEIIYNELIYKAAEDSNYDSFLFFNSIFPDGVLADIIEPAARGNNLDVFGKFIRYELERDRESGLFYLRVAIIYLIKKKKIDFLTLALKAYHHYGGDKEELYKKMREEKIPPERVFNISKNKK